MYLMYLASIILYHHHDQHYNDNFSPKIKLILWHFVLGKNYNVKSYNNCINKIHLVQRKTLKTSFDSISTR